MARPKSNNVDYFPCYCKDGKTLYILESRWGNAGYAFFYKLWKRLGDSDFHYIDLRPLDNWEYFRARMGVSDTETTDILNKLAEMKVIDLDLWSNKIIWSDSFVESVKEVWIKRKQLIPQKPLFLIQKQELPPQNESETAVNENQNPQSKVNKSKVNNNTLCVYSNAFQSFWSEYPKPTAKKAAFKEWEKNHNKPSIDLILEALRAQKRNKAELKSSGQFCPEWPDPERWIKKERWNDELIPVEGSKKPTPQAQADPYVICQKCGAEVLHSDFEEIDGERYCIKCPKFRERSEIGYKKISNQLQSHAARAGG
jgi:hypothetical protein